MFHGQPANMTLQLPVVLPRFAGRTQLNVRTLAGQASVLIQLQATQMDLARRTRAGEERALQELFDARRSAPLMEHGEGFTVGRFDDLDGIAPEVAFLLSSAAVAIAGQQDDQASLGVALDLLLTLAHASRTTELPPGLATIWPILGPRVQEASALLCLRALSEWYRMPIGDAG